MSRTDGGNPRARAAQAGSSARRRQYPFMWAPQPDGCTTTASAPARSHESLEPDALVEAQRRHHQRERPRRREEQPEVQPSDGPPHGAAGALALDLRPRRLDEPTVGNAGRADGLARPTVEAEREVRDGRVREV